MQGRPTALTCVIYRLSGLLRNCWAMSARCQSAWLGGNVVLRSRCCRCQTAGLDKCCLAEQSATGNIRARATSLRPVPGCFCSWNCGCGACVQTGSSPLPSRFLLTSSLPSLRPILLGCPEGVAWPQQQDTVGGKHPQHSQRAGHHK